METLNCEGNPTLSSIVVERVFQRLGRGDATIPSPSIVERLESIYVLSVVSDSFVAPFSASLFPKMFGFVLLCQDRLPAI